MNKITFVGFRGALAPHPGSVAALIRVRGANQITKQNSCAWRNRNVQLTLFGKCTVHKTILSQ